ncbi:hypothetical protein FHS45_000573 [Thalassobacillus devorans]|nr:hypothetical protein [Thalassobacillus devorans]NIK27482.1 hypothetical protein [Thalassobacillus devorans]
MKTERVPITITKKMVQEYEEIFGEQSTLPPTFAMIFYRFIELPWRTTSPAILRKQYGTCEKELDIDETYQCQVILKVNKQRSNHVFYTQSLYLYDQHEEVCSKCVSELVTKSPLQKK